jgi:hypothetical protein
LYGPGRGDSVTTPAIKIDKFGSAFLHDAAMSYMHTQQFSSGFMQREINAESKASSTPSEEERSFSSLTFNNHQPKERHHPN